MTTLLSPASSQKLAIVKAASRRCLISSLSSSSSSPGAPGLPVPGRGGGWEDEENAGPGLAAVEALKPLFVVLSLFSTVLALPLPLAPVGLVRACCADDDDDDNDVDLIPVRVL